jgi:hypothetical protein
LNIAAVSLKQNSQKTDSFSGIAGKPPVDAQISKTIAKVRAAKFEKSDILAQFRA